MVRGDVRLVPLDDSCMRLWGVEMPVPLTPFFEETCFVLGELAFVTESCFLFNVDDFLFKGGLPPREALAFVDDVMCKD